MTHDMNGQKMKCDDTRYEWPQKEVGWHKI